MKLESKTIERNYEFVNCLNYPYAERWANDVIDSMENDELLVFDFADEKALDMVEDSDGAINPFVRATIPVKINEWLAIGCQYLRWQNHVIDYDLDRKDAMAYYYSNAVKVLCPPHAEFDPQGPSAFLGEIILLDNVYDMVWQNHNNTEKKFKFIIAHELVHVFDNMRFLVPAFMNWASFYEHVLNDGGRNDILLNLIKNISGFLDNYGEKTELVSLLD